jgi:AraC-like DNA-binding protein
MLQPKHNISWLIDDMSSVEVGGQLNKLKIEIPLPSDIGHGHSEHLHLPGGILVIQSKLFFNRTNNNLLPPKLPYGIFETQFPSVVLFIHIVHKGEMEMISKTTGQAAIRTAGTNLFAMFDQFTLEQNIHTKEDLAYTGIAIPQETLNSLVGDELYKQLLKALMLSESGDPHANVINVPKSISMHLQNSLPDSLQQNLRALHAKSQILQYLSDIILHLNAKDKPLITEEPSIIADELYHYLINLEGATPTLMDLAKKFGINAIKLNNEFSKKYGESIYSFIINLRLSQAKQALTSSKTPMKIISARIGYSNVNNFIAAFKKKYGITPGALRNKR